MLTYRLNKMVLVALLTTAWLGCGDDGGTGGSGGAGGASGSGGSGGTAGTGGSGGTAGTGGSGGGLPAEWSCVGSVVYPDAPEATLDIERSYFDPNFDPLQGATIAACAADGDCSTPLDTAVTDAMGVAALTLPTPGVGFLGYFRQTGTDLVPLNQWVLPPIADATHTWLSESQAPVLFTTGEWAAFASDAGVTVEAGKGHVIATTLNCDGELDGAASVELDGASPQFAEMADAVFFNVDPGTYTLVATLDDGTETGTFTVTVVADETVAVMFGPTP